MEIFNLSLYTKSHLFLDAVLALKKFDIFLLEENTDLKNDKKTKKAEFINMIEESHLNGGLVGVLGYYIEKAVCPMIIVDKLDISYFLPILKNNYINKDITLILCNSGLSSFGVSSNKHTPVSEFLNSGYNVYDPYDLNSFFDFLERGGNKILRLDSNELLGNSSLESKVNKSSVSLVDKGHSGKDATIVFGGSYISNAITTSNLLKEKGFFCDLFLLYDYSLSLNGGLGDSIKNTERLVLVLDNERDLMYEAFIKAKLRDSGIFETEVVFIYPNYTALNTVFDEYKQEQASFDPNSIMINIMNFFNRE